MALKLTYLTNKSHFLTVYRRDNPRGMLGEQEPKASHLQAFRVLSQHPEWVITPVNPWKVWSIAFIK